MTADSSGIVGNDVDDDVVSDGSDDTTYSTWRAPPQDLRGNKYQNEMKVRQRLYSTVYVEADIDV